MDINPPGVGDKIRMAIKSSGLSDRLIHERSGLSIQAVNCYRNGTRLPSAGSLVKLAKGLRIPVSELI